MALPSSSPSPVARVTQTVRRATSVPPDWTGTTSSTTDGAELGVYLPRRTYRAGERADALVVLRNAGVEPLDPRACNGEVYFELVLTGASGREVYSWAGEHFPPRPNQPTLPRCTYMGSPSVQLQPGQAVQGTLTFRAPATPGRYAVVARRAQAEAPAPAVPIDVTDPTSVPFSTLALGERYDVTLGQAPLLSVAGTPEKVATLADRLLPHDATRVLQADLAGSWVVLVTRGMVGAGGYSLVVEAVRPTDDGVEVLVRRTVPEPGRAYPAASNHPYQVIVVERARLPDAPGTVWQSRTRDGILLAEARQP